MQQSLKAILPAFIFLFGLTVTAQNPGAVSIPAYISYAEPEETGVDIDEKLGITNWNSDKVELQCYFYLPNTGKLEVSILASVPNESVIQLSLNNENRELKMTKTSGEETVNAGSFTIEKAGYYCLKLKGMNRKGPLFPAVRAFLISGQASAGVHFNTKPRRNAASVHLRYPFPEGTRAEWFYNEVTVPEGFDPVTTFYMANGFKRGYFGIQANSKTERRVIFSVWDSGQEAIDRNKVNDENRVKLLRKGDDVVANDFGNEGTGGHSHWVYPWKTGQTYRFLLHAKPEGEFTTYSGYFFLNDSKEWKLIASFRAPKDGNYLSNLYSFVENFWGSNGQRMRKALYSNQWIRTSEGEWKELTTAIFTHDPTGREERKDYGSGVENSGFYLFNGGFVPGTAKFGDQVTRSSNPKRPEFKLPEE
jgi:hypothetical protein